MHWAEVWHGAGPGPIAIRTALTPISWLYAAGWEVYATAYRLGLKTPSEPHRPVVCIGSLSVGGSGKTPFTLYIGRLLDEQGRKVVIGCSGYGSPGARGATIAPDGELDPAEWGDEPAMFRWLAPHLRIVVGRDRVEAARLVHAAAPDAVLLMDDGFQHLRLRKHVAILLNPPEANRRCLPAGPNREPHRNAKRADLVLPDGMRAVASFSGFLNPRTAVTAAIGSRAQVLCALGSPAKFLGALRAQGLEVVYAKLLSDHDPMAAGNLFEGLKPEFPVVVSAKDWVKLRGRPDVQNWDIRVALHEVRAEPESEFRAWLARKLDGISHKPVSR